MSAVTHGNLLCSTLNVPVPCECPTRRQTALRFFFETPRTDLHTEVVGPLMPETSHIRGTDWVCHGGNGGKGGGMAGVAEGVVRGSGADAVVGEAPHQVAQERQQEGGGRGRGAPDP